MNVKIDTREKFHVITILEEEMTGNMTEELNEVLNKIRANGVKNIIMNLSGVTNMDAAIAGYLLNTQQTAYEQQQSFVFCCLQPGLETWLDNSDLLEMMNVTPTESEAWDIVQMEEIERELL